MKPDDKTKIKALTKYAARLETENRVQDRLIRVQEETIQILQEHINELQAMLDKIYRH